VRIFWKEDVPMKNKYKTVFWGFFSLDYKAMETYLREMAGKGWMLEKLGRMTAKFRAIEPKNLQFYVDVFTEGGPLTPENTREAEEYRSLCQESGWSFITSQDYLQFFYAEEGTNPIPIQTDQALEQKIVESTLWKNELIGILLFLIVSVIGLFKLYPLSHINFLTFTGVAGTFLYPLLGIPVMFIAIYDLIWMLKARKNIRRGLAIEKPTLKGARRRAMAFHIPTYIIGFIIIIALVADAFFLPDVLVISLLPLAIGSIIGFSLRYIIKKKLTDKKDSIVYVLLAVIVITITILIVPPIDIGRSGNYTNNIEAIPDDYPVVTMCELNTEYEQGRLVGSEFSPRMSPITPRQYNYWETRDINGIMKGIRVNYYKTIGPYYAQIIFHGLAEKMQQVITWRSMTIRNKSVIADEEMRALWNMDNLVLTEDKDEILMQKGNTILHLSGDIDFEEKEIRELIINRFFK